MSGFYSPEANLVESSKLGGEQALHSLSRPLRNLAISQTGTCITVQVSGFNWMRPNPGIMVIHGECTG